MVVILGHQCILSLPIEKPPYGFFQSWTESGEHRVLIGWVLPFLTGAAMIIVPPTVSALGFMASIGSAGRREINDPKSELYMKMTVYGYLASLGSIPLGAVLIAISLI